MYIQIFGKESCPDSEAALVLSKSISEKNQCLHNYVYKELNKDFTEEEFIEKFSVNDIPQVIVNGTTVGGYTELKQYMEDRADRI